jgi:hypothetical protein
MTEEQEVQLREAFARCREYVGCGDSSCLFKRPTGMRTNGGCRCIEYAKAGVRPTLANLYRVVENILGNARQDD